ncbi:hypothetical protein [Clostridium sp.]|uniref:hypothetical protein n=1 Tax=Clostridium sp. TaxID=1506 RepID=UPI003D6D5070
MMVQNQLMVQHLPYVDKTTIIYDEVNILTAKLEPINMDGASNNVKIPEGTEFTAVSSDGAEVTVKLSGRNAWKSGGKYPSGKKQR